MTNRRLRKIVYGALALGLIINGIFHVVPTEGLLAAGCTSLFFIE